MKNRLLFALFLIVPFFTWGQSNNWGIAKYAFYIGSERIEPGDTINITGKTAYKGKFHVVGGSKFYPKWYFSELHFDEDKPVISKQSIETKVDSTKYWGIAAYHFDYPTVEGSRHYVAKGDTLFFNGKDDRGYYRPVDARTYMFASRFVETFNTENLQLGKSIPVNQPSATKNSFYNTSTKSSSTYKSSRSRSSSSYRSSSSSYCGAKNRTKAGYCKRRVKGGGRCYQHGG